jgi:hypothetical protein
MALRHSRQQPAHEHHEHGAVLAESATVREPIGVAQGLAVAIGVFFIVVGAIGLARTGTRSLSANQTEVAGLAMSGLLALIHLGIGLVAAIGAATRNASRGVLFFLGPALIAMGIIAIAQPVRQLAWNGATGIAYLIIGVAALVAAALTPVAALEERFAQHRSSVIG